MRPSSSSSNCRRTRLAPSYEISATPRVLLFAGGNAVAELIGLHSRDAICQEIDKVLARPIDELPKLNPDGEATRVDKKARAKSLSERLVTLDRTLGAKAEYWGDAFLSGLIAGIVMA